MTTARYHVCAVTSHDDTQEHHVNKVVNDQDVYENEISPYHIFHTCKIRYFS